MMTSKIISLNIHNIDWYMVGSYYQGWSDDYSSHTRISRIEEVVVGFEKIGVMSSFDIYIVDTDTNKESFWRHVSSSERTVEYET